MTLPFNEQLARIDPLTHEIADRFYRLEFSSALQLLPQLLEESEQLIAERQQANIQASRTNEVLSFMGIIYTALDKKDYILLADLLKFEWIKCMGLLKYESIDGEVL